jgi:single-stranded-DNA-specific exonuclease
LSPDAVCAAAFKGAVSTFRSGLPVLVMSHNDADGLSAAAILARALAASGRQARTRIVGRGETPWSEPIRSELGAAELGGLIVADLGTRPGLIVPGVPTVVIDHHVPVGVPDQATLISGHAFEPIPTSSLLAWWCASALGDASDLLWLAALGLIGDMAEKAGFPELDEARRRYGITALREAVSLINAPRRSASGDPGPAFALLMTALGPKEITSGNRPEVAALRAAKDEVKAALEAAKRVAPKVRKGIALLRFDTPCQVHPLLAQTWRGRLKGEIVIAANAGYRPGWVHFAARTARDLSLIEFLAERAPPGADENYGSGHAGASGGALRPAAWNTFVTQLGFGTEEQVAP